MCRAIHMLTMRLILECVEVRVLAGKNVQGKRLWRAQLQCVMQPYLASCQKEIILQACLTLSQTLLSPLKIVLDEEIGQKIRHWIVVIVLLLLDNLMKSTVIINPRNQQCNV